MQFENYLEIGSIILLAILLFIFVPRDKIREAQIIFLFKQMITWLFGHLVVEFNLIRYPVRLFPTATNTSFTFEFFVYPSLCVFFNLYYPKNKSLLKRISHYVLYVTSITIVEVILELYTDTIMYVNWTWWLTWITLLLTFMASRIYYRWFFMKK